MAEQWLQETKDNTEENSQRKI